MNRQRIDWLERCGALFLLLPLLAGAMLKGAAPAEAAIRLVYTIPANGEVVSATGPFVLKFDYAIRPHSFVQTADSPTIQLTPPTGAGGSIVKWTIGFSPEYRRVTLVPSVPLDVNRTYQLYISGVDDPNPVREDNYYGSRLLKDGSTNPVIFTVKDDIAPALRGVSPHMDATGVPLNARIGFSATEPLDPATVRIALNGVDLPVESQGGGHQWKSAPVLKPSTLYTVQATGADYGGNRLAAEWSFTTAATDAPDTTPPRLTGSSPEAFAINVAPETEPTLTFNEPMAAFSAEVRLTQCHTGIPDLAVSWEMAPDGRSLKVKPSVPLIPGPTCYRLEALLEDLAGNPLSATGELGDEVTFTTSDLTPPALIRVLPEPAATVHPRTGPEISLYFSEEPLKGVLDAPVLKMAYATGEPTPLLDPRDAKDLGNGRWRLSGEGWITPYQVNLRVLPIPEDAQGNRYRSGDTLLFTLESTMDGAGNGLREENSINPWSVKIEETRPPTLLEMLPAEGSRASLQAPVVMRFNLAVDPAALIFEADGDWSPSATEIFNGSKRYSPRRWVSKTLAWSDDRREVVLNHAPFEPNGTDSLETRVLKLLPPVWSPFLYAEGLTGQRTWLTGPRPRVEAVEYLAPADPALDLSENGLLLAPDDSARTAWRAYPLPEAAPQLPLNTRLRVRYSEAMDMTTVGPPALSSSAYSLQFQMSDERIAYLDLSPHLMGWEATLARGTDGKLKTAAYPLSLAFSHGRNLYADSLAPLTLGLAPLDLRAPQFTVEYLANANPDGSKPSVPDWRPLDGATVHPQAPWRVVADEPLAGDAGVILLPGEIGPDVTLAVPSFSERVDAGGKAGNAVEVYWAAPMTDNREARPGEDFVEASVRVRVADMNAMPGPNVSERTVAFRVGVPRRPHPDDLDGDGDLDLSDLSLALKTYLNGNSQLLSTDLNALYRIYLLGLTR